MFQQGFRLTAEKPRQKILWILLGLTAAGFLMRILCCFWGYPYCRLHPDEYAIVDTAMEMLSRHSWEADIYNRPDHFEIKCCAVLFQAVSWLRYHLPAWEAIEADPGREHTFYLIARAFTAFWGTMMIPLGFLILEKCRKNAGLAGAAVIAFFPIFVRHSAYATPDIVLSFFVMALTWVSVLYLENPSGKKVALMGVLIGIGITVKYTAAIGCIWVAAAVCGDCIRRRKYGDILRYGFLCLAVILATAFVIGPNLFTNFPKTAETFMLEAGDVHLGADGFNAWKNFRFYLETFVNSAGMETVPLLLLGMVYVIRKHTRETACLLNGLFFWICTSVLALHYERWGMPIYFFLWALVVLGFFQAWEWTKKFRAPVWSRIGRGISCGLMILILGNGVLSGMWTVRQSLMEDSRIAGKLFCDIHGVNRDNTVYDGYSPLAMNDSVTIPTGVSPEGTLMMPVSNLHPLFLMVSSSLYDRFYAEPERYAEIIRMYELIDKSNELIYRSNVYESHDSRWCGPNMIAKIYDLIHSRGGETGPEIKIYRYRG